MRRFVLVLLALGLLLSLAVAPARGSTDEIPNLLNRVRVTASEPRSMLVRLPEDVSVARGLPFEISGGGRIRGFAMAMTKYPFPKAPSVTWMQSGRCLKKACDAKHPNGPTKAYSFGKYLPAGTYRLWAIADAPMRLTLRLKELPQGTLALRPRDKHLSRVEVLAPHASANDSAFYSGTLVSPRLARAVDISVLSMWIETDRWTETEVGDCFYEWPDDRWWWLRSVAAEVLFAPPCRLGQSSWEDGQRWIYENPQGPTGKGRLLTFDVADYYGDIGIGGWARTTGTVTDAGAVGFWMDLDPAR